MAIRVQMLLGNKLSNEHIPDFQDVHFLPLCPAVCVWCMSPCTGEEVHAGKHVLKDTIGV